MKALEFKYNFRISLSALFLVLINPSVSSQELEDYIIQLEQVMSQRTEFDQLKENRINSLIKKKSSISSAYDSYKINDKIYDEYEFYNFDNALGYIEKNLYLATLDLVMVHMTLDLVMVHMILDLVMVHTIPDLVMVHTILDLVMVHMTPVPVMVHTIPDLVMVHTIPVLVMGGQT